MTRQELRAACRALADKGRELSALEHQVSVGFEEEFRRLQGADSPLVDPQIVEALAELAFYSDGISSLLDMHAKCLTLTVAFGPRGVAARVKEAHAAGVEAALASCQCSDHQRMREEAAAICEATARAGRAP